MTTHYRSLDRSKRVAIFLASVVIAVTLLSAVTLTFRPAAPPLQIVDSVEEMVIQG